MAFFPLASLRATIGTMVPPPRLPRGFFHKPTLIVARDLLGQRLVRLDTPPLRLESIILETEAYIGMEDLGCHARAGLTQRNASMWGEPGHAYVYFTYGMHWMLNVVTERRGLPAAVLIRALLPLQGIQVMSRRRGGKPLSALTNGPAKLCQAMAIDRRFDGHDLCAPEAQLYIEAAPAVSEECVIVGPRVGLTRVPEPWKSMPWRFQVSPAYATRLAEEVSLV